MNRQMTAILMDDAAATLVVAERDGVERHSVTWHSQNTPQQKAQIIAQAMASLGQHDAEVVLAIPSLWCMAASVKMGDDAKRTHEALSYRLEEQLPIAAEDFVADFAPLPSSSESDNVPPTQSEDDAQTPQCATQLGVCVHGKQLEPLIQSLEDEGIRVGWICPAALLVGQHMIGQQTNADRALAIKLNGHIDILLTHAGAPTRWFIALEDSAAIKRILKTEGWTSQPRQSDAPQEDAAAAATLIARGDATPWVNFRRDSLAVNDRFRGIRGTLLVLIASYVLLMLCLTGAMLLRTHRYNLATARVHDQQMDILKKTLPDNHVFVAPQIQLTSERRRLAGLRDANALPDLAASSLSDLVRLLESLPANMRYRILELRLEPDRISIDGQARSHSDAEVIAQTLRTKGGFEITPPRTQALKDKGVGFMLQMHPASHGTPEAPVMTIRPNQFDKRSPRP